jgi:fatty acid desaturase
LKEGVDKHMAKKCIICQQDIAGGRAAPVKNDLIIETIRKLKKMLGVAQGNELYVCENDFKSHAEKRKKFERNVVIFSTVALLIVLIMIGLPLLAGHFDVVTFLSSIAIGAIIVLLVILFEYTPATGELEEIKREVETSTETKKELANKVTPQKDVKKKVKR